MQGIEIADAVAAEVYRYEVRQLRDVLDIDYTAGRERKGLGVCRHNMAVDGHRIRKAGVLYGAAAEGGAQFVNGLTGQGGVILNIKRAQEHKAAEIVKSLIRESCAAETKRGKAAQLAQAGEAPERVIDKIELGKPGHHAEGSSARDAVVRGVEEGERTNAHERAKVAQLVIRHIEPFKPRDVHKRAEIAYLVIAEIQPREFLAVGERGDIAQTHAAEVKLRNIRLEGSAAEAYILHFLLRGLAVDGTVGKRFGERLKLALGDADALDAQARQVREAAQRRKIGDGVIVKIQGTQRSQLGQGLDIADIVAAEVQRREPAESGEL